MSDGKQILKNIFSLSVAEMAAKGFTMIYTLYLIRIIGPENNGVFTVVKSYVGYLLIFIWLGFDQVGIREVVKDRNQTGLYVGSILMIRLIIAVSGYMLLILIIEILNLYSPVETLTKMVIYIYGLILFGNAIQLYWIYQAIERMYILAIRSLIINTLNLIGILVFVKNESDFLIAIWIIVTTFFINAVWMIYYYLHYVDKIKIVFDLKLWRNILVQSFRIGMVFLIVVIYNNIVVQILSYYKGDKITGIYGAATSFITFGLIPSGILQNAFFPRISKMETVEERNNIVSKFLLLGIIAGVAISFTLFTFSDAIVVILGKKYEATNGIIKFLSVTILIEYISISFFSPLIAWKKEKIVVFANLAGLSACTLFSFIFIPMYGYYGAAIAAIACETAVLIVVGIIYYRMQGTLYLSQIFKVLITAIPPFVLGHFILEGGLNVYFSTLVSFIVFFSLILALKIVRISELRTLISK